jgi:ABC-type dipeptide/oligopeptide/nickel transport system ATPase component
MEIKMQNGQVTKDNITLIDVDKVGGATAFLVGGSSSGKSSLLVQALSNILDQHPDRYDVIFIFSESENAVPIKDWLMHNQPTKVHFFPNFIPELVTIMVQINKATDNRYGTLVVLDDCLELLRSKTMNKAINIYRNSNISTIVSIQYPKFVSPAMRASFHRVWITGAKNYEIQKSILDIFIKGYMRKLGYKTIDRMIEGLEKMTKMNEKDREIMLLDQIKSDLTTHTIKK